jgi:DNA/RNA-binding domain of Phe-tRNA-synthetase-like protein
MADRDYRLKVDATLDPSPVLPALIWAEGIEPPRPTEAAPGFVREILARAEAGGEEFIPAERRARVRKILRHGHYQPSGRGRPASEFLLRAALERAFPLVNGPVDVNNAVSLASGLPGSIFDADLSGTHLLLRRGLPGESYVFNTAGQVINLEDLLLVCRRTETGWEPCGNAVKDAMATKVRETTGRVVAVLYAPPDEPLASLERWAARVAELLTSHCRAHDAGFTIVDA